MWCSRHCYGWLRGCEWVSRQSSPFGCHVAVSDVASGGVNKGGDGIEGRCCGRSCHGSGVEADNNIGRRCLGVLVTGEVLALSMMAVMGGCRHCRGGDVAHCCHVGVVAGSGCVAWQSMWGPTHCLAHGGRSRHMAAVTNSGDGLDGG